MKQFGLIGFPLSHSFSKKYFTKKFEKENIKDCSYELFEIETIDGLKNVLTNSDNLVGLNVTIPYKQAIIPFLDDISKEAKAIGAVNTVKIVDGKLIGYNSDVFGFSQSLKPFFKSYHERALILGTGGASKAVHFALNSLGVDCLFASRNPKENNEIGYDKINDYVMKHHLLIINTTPLGTHPNVATKPELPYQFITDKHLLYDLVYNPEQTEFLKLGKEQGATTINGLQMLILQAEKSWDIWKN